MSLRKMADIKAPHAVYSYGDWHWSVLKVNQPSKGIHTPFATWMCAVQSPMTFGGHDYGDTYADDVLRQGRLQSCTKEFEEYLKR